MATLVLSTVGSMAAGPVGGLLGTLVGQAIDQQLMGGGPRRGPRLGDLSVQMSAYGAMIPRVYGTMRVAGTVVWATDLKEIETLQGDGKSGPETVAYLYSASFAVALSSRTAKRVGRIWADGKLIRGSAGDMKVGGTFRFLPGSEDQPVDALIGSVEGPQSAPAYRGLALAIFEDLELAPFGNRIPNLTFELVAVEDGETLGEVLADASGGLIASADQRAVAGYAHYGSDAAAALSPLVEAFSLDLVEAGNGLRQATAGEARTVAADLLGSSVDARTESIERRRTRAGDLPSEVCVTYHDKARDYQSGLARAAIPAAHRATRSLALPIVSDAVQAKTIAEAALRRAWSDREMLNVRLPAMYLNLVPGDRLTIEGVRGLWQVDQVTIEQLAVVARLRSVVAAAQARPSDPGRSIVQPDIVATPLHLVLLDLPDVQGKIAGPSLQLAVTSPTGAYRRVPIEVSVSGVVSAMASAAAEAVSGTVHDLMPPAPAGIVDLCSNVEVTLVNADHWLESRDETALANGANLAAIGDEVVQFGKAEALGDGRFRLSHMLRGRGGSEWAIGEHRPGEAFVLLNASALASIPFVAGQIASEITVTAYGPNNLDSLPRTSRIAYGEAARPLSPCHFAAATDVGGGIDLSWIGRGRSAWAWLDSVEAMPDPDFGGFRVTLSGPLGTLERATYDSQLIVNPEDAASIGAPIVASVRQAGSIGLSRAATLTFHP